MKKILAVVLSAAMLAACCASCADVLTENWRDASDEELTMAADALNSELQRRKSNLLTERLRAFFYYWNADEPDEMLALCATEWQNGTENPGAALAALTDGRYPKNLMIEHISGTDADTNRTVTAVSLMQPDNSEEPVRYRMSIDLIREGDTWYVYPPSLRNFEAVESQEPADAEARETAGPTAAPAVDPATVLYYHPEGGAYYHLDPNCRRVKDRYLPLKGTFTYAEVNTEPYASLAPCNICGAPGRE